METLFELTQITNPAHRCKECIHIYDHYYGKMKYCKKQKDPRTSYGHKKIKANDPSCPMFEKEK